MKGISLDRSIDLLHQNSTVVSAHHDILIDLQRRRELGETDIFKKGWIPRLRKGGVNVQVFPVCIDSQYLPESALRRAIQMIEALDREIEQNPDDIALVNNFGDITEANRKGKIAAMISLEGGECLGNDPGMLRMFYKLGVRMASLTWNRRTALADGAGQGRTKGGLTSLGVEALQEMERLGIIIDISHLSDAGFWDATDVTRRPLIASHSNVRTLCDHPRNLTNEQIETIARRQGAIGILLHPSLIDPKKPTVARVVDHIEHIANLVGVDHVGLGPDFVCDIFPPNIRITSQAEVLIPVSQLYTAIEGLETVAELPNLTNALSIRGFSEKDIGKILGENFLRVFKKVLTS